VRDSSCYLENGGKLPQLGNVANSDSCDVSNTIGRRRPIGDPTSDPTSGNERWRKKLVVRCEQIAVHGASAYGTVNDSRRHVEGSKRATGGWPAIVSGRTHKRRSSRLATDVDQTLPKTSTTPYLGPVVRPDGEAYRVEEKRWITRRLGQATRRSRPVRRFRQPGRPIVQ
jgi:hypothetical protein